jgi:hypothetical protein
MIYLLIGAIAPTRTRLEPRLTGGGLPKRGSAAIGYRVAL